MVPQWGWCLLVALSTGCSGSPANEGSPGDPSDQGPAVADQGPPAQLDLDPQPDLARDPDTGRVFLVDAGSPTDAELAEADSASREDVPDLGSPEAEGCQVTGVVLDLLEAPLAGLRMTLCDERHCYSTDSDEVGHYRFQRVELDLPLAIKPLSEARGFGQTALPGIRCQTVTDRIRIEPLRLPPLLPGTPIEAAIGGEVAVLTELTLRLPPGMELPGFARVAEIRAARLDPALLHPALAAQVQPFLVFVLAPFGALARTETIGFTAQLELDAGTPVQAHYLDHLTGEIRPLFQGVSEPDGTIRSPPAGGLPELTWLLFTR